MVAGMKSQLAALGIDIEHEVAKGSLMMSSEQNHLLGDWEFDVPSMLRTLERALQPGFERRLSGPLGDR